MYDAHGKPYIDYCMAYGALLLGHAYPEIMEAVKNQLPKGSLYGAPTEREVEFAELISQSFALHGNAAARQLRHRSHYARHPSSKRLHGTQKNHKVRRLLPRLARQRLVKAGSGAATFGDANSLGIPEETTQNTIVLPYNDVEALEAAMQSRGQ